MLTTSSGVKRRLSAPGRRRSTGLELKPERKEESFAKSEPPLSDTRYQPPEPSKFVDSMCTKAIGCTKPFEHENIHPVRSPQVMRLRASARKSIKSLQAESAPKQNFRAPAREARPGDRVQAYSCPECAKFTQLLKSERLSSSVIQAASRHRMFCAPSLTPPNLWDPWKIESSPLTNLCDPVVEESISS